MMKISSNVKIRRSEDEWQEIFARFRESGMTGAAFCPVENIAKSSFSKRKAMARVQRRKPAFVVLTRSSRTVEASAPDCEMTLTLPGGAVLRWKT